LRRREMYQRILIPLDGSKTGEAALPYVEELVSSLSPQIKIEVTLLHVVSIMAHYAVAEEPYAQMPYAEEELEQNKKHADDYLNKISEALESKGVIVTTLVGIGNAADEILRTSDEVNADLIAMSTHGRSGITRWAFGSVTDRVLRGSKKPILLVRAS